MLPPRNDQPFRRGTERELEHFNDAIGSRCGRKMAIKGERIQNNICLGMHQGVIMNTEDSCFDFCLSDSLSLECFHFGFLWSKQLKTETSAGE